MLGAGGLAHAQTTVLVSNIGRTASGTNPNITTTSFLGQGFTTGSNSDGYTLGSVELAVFLFSGNASTITVSIYSESSGNPGTLVHTLTTPASISAPATTFTAPSGTTLADSTTYYVVITTTGGLLYLSTTNGGAEDTGGASGWSIANNHRYTRSGNWETASGPLRMRINGTAGAAASTDATLSGLVLNDGTNDLTLTPTFATDTTSYAASVANDIDRITVAPETNDDGATVAYLDENDAEIGDADGTTEGQQVALAEGTNTIKVKVMAEDGTTTQTYTVVVTRQAQAQPGIWSATLIAGEIANVAGCNIVFAQFDPAMNCASPSVLSNDAFTHDGTPYTIQGLVVSGGGLGASLEFEVTPDFTDSAAELTLMVDGTAFAFEDGVGGSGTVKWSDTGLSWTAGDTIALSLTASATTATTAPDPPTSLSATANGETQIDLSWTAPADAGGSAITGYRIEWSADGSDPWTALSDDTESTDTTYADTGLTAGTTRHYRVSAINSVGAGAASSVASTTTDVPVTVTVADTLSTLEDDGAVEIAVTATTGIDAPPPRPFEIQLATADGTATAFFDYIPLNSLVGFAVDDFSAKEIDGVFRWQATQHLLVPISSDVDIEDDETFTMTLIRPEGLSPSIVLGTPKTLTVTILNDDGIDATLSGLAVNDGTNDLTLTPTFATDTTSYAASVANDIDRITVAPETTDDSATVAYLDASDAEITDADGNTEGHQVALDMGANTIKVEVTAADGMTTQTYTLTVTRAASTDPTLTGLTLSDGTLDPAFAAATENYTAEVALNVRTVTVTPTTSHSGASYEITPADADFDDNNGHQVYLAAGDTTDITVEVTAEDDSTTETYTVQVSRSGSVLTAPQGQEVTADWPLIPSGLGAGDSFRLLFVTSTTRNAESDIIGDYDTHVQNAVALGDTAIRNYRAGFRALASTPSVDGRDNTATTGTGVPIYWLGGDRVADDYGGIYDQQWDSYDPKDESGTSDTTTIVWTGSANDGSEVSTNRWSDDRSVRSTALGSPSHGSNGRWSGYGDPTQAFFMFRYLVGVSDAAQSAAHPLYGLSPVFTVLASTDPTLTALTLSDGTLDPVFASDTYAYAVSVENSVDTITVTPTTAHDSATVAYLDASDAEITDADGNTEGHQVALDVGGNVIKVQVTAADGVTTQTYTLTVTRAAQLSVVSIAADTTRTTIDIGTASFTLTRTGPTTDTLTVDVEVTEEFRYVTGPLPTTATFAADESEAKLEFNRLWGRGTSETGDLTVTIQDGTDYDVSATAASASIEVVVLDPVMTFTLDAAEKAVAEAVDSFTVTVTAETAEGATKPQATQGMEVVLSPRDGTATVGDDYESFSTHLVFAPDDFTLSGTVYRAEKTQTVAIVDDDLFEPPVDGDEESFTVLLERTPGTRARIAIPDTTDAPGAMVVTIEDDDKPDWKLTVEPDSIAEAGTESSTVTVLTGGKTFAADQTITLMLAGTATETDDFTLASKSLTLTAGDTLVTATITAVDDTLDDDDETILVTASHDGATIGEPQTITITDDDTQLPNTSLTPSPDDPEVSSPSKAEYSVAFTGAWTTTAADEVPSGAHFSPLIGGVHNDQVTFLEAGDTASAGVESMAEIGATAALRGEVEASTNATGVLQRSGNIDPTASATLTATLTTDHPRVTLLTMIAPSPDWFVGVSGLSLLDGSGEWVASRTVDLYAWDAGTEDGTEFDLDNVATSPKGVITNLRGVGKFSNEKIATLTLTRGTVTSTDAALSALTLSDGTLDPAFASDTYAYTADVTGSVDTITVTPTTTNDGATVAYLDASDAEIADADGSTEGQQVALAVGANTIKVQVTAEDSVTTQTYTLTVTRAAQLSVVSIAAGTTRTTIGIGTAPFTLTRTEPTAEALTVEVSVTQDDTYVPGATPTALIFDAGKAELHHVFARLLGDATSKGNLTITIQDADEYEVSATAASDSIEVLVFDPPLIFRLDAAAKSVAEDGGTVDVTVIAETAAGATRPDFDLDVRIRAPSGTATRNVDFTALREELTFAPDSFYLDVDVWRAEKTNSITILNDAVVEDDEQFTVLIEEIASSPLPEPVDIPGTTDAPSTMTVTITDDDTQLPNTSLTPSPDDPEVSSPSKAEYSVAFTGAWTTTAADEVPSGAHFSPLIGGVHNDQVTFLEAGDTASAGVESMAEIGGTAALRGEVEASTNATGVLQRTGNIDPTASATLTATLTTDHPRVTLLTMIAPSPDWFVGVSGLSLLDGSGEWVASRTVDLYAWDAGTEDGTEFDLDNVATSPKGVITNLRGAGKFSNEKIATLILTRGTVTSTDATLSGLTLSDGTLDPAFASDTYAYTADVASSVDTITVTPTTTNDGATVAYLDENDAEIADADGSTEGQQVALAAGANTINVTVTAEDGMTTQTYTVTVTRAEALAATITDVAITSDPDAAGRDDDTYAIGDTVKVTVTFSAEVTVDVTNGVPTLELDFEGAAKTAAYDAAASSGAAVVFSYTVVEDDATDKDGVGIEADKLALNGGTIRIGGTDAVVEYLAVEADPAHLVYGVRPEFTAAVVDRTVNASALVLRFGEDLDTLSTPANSAFAVSVNGTGNTVTGVAIAGVDVTLTLATAVAADDTTMVVTYTVPQTSPIRNPVGNDADGFMDEKVDVRNPLTAAWDSLPARHDGTSGFTVRILFSDPIDRGLNDFVAAMEVTGGTIAGRRRVGGNKAHIELEMQPVGNGDVTLVLPATQTVCTDTGAICTADGRVLSARLEGTVIGPSSIGVTVEPTEVDATEGGATGSYTVVLKSQPTDTVTVAVADTSADLSASPTTLTFTTANWDTAQTVTVTAVDDDVDEDEEDGILTHTATSTDGSYDGATVADVTVTITDDDTRGVKVSETTLAFTEGGSGTYTVALESQPTATVTVGVTTTGDADVTVSPDTLTFTTATWSTAQTVTVRGAEDADAANDTATVRHTVSGGDYGANNVAADSVAVTVNDDETASTGVTLSVSPNSVGEGDGATTLTVTGTLSGGAFAADTAVALAVSAGSAAASDFTAGTATLTIDAGQTADTATLTLTPVADDVDEADETVTVGGTAMGLTVTGATVTITDDDTRGVKVSKTTLAFTEGGSGTYTVKLESQPTATVKIALSVTGDSDVTVSADTLTFTTGNWSTAQTVTVSGAQDADAANDTATVRHTVSGGDYGTNNVAADSVAVTVNDDETASSGLTLSVSPASVGEGAGATTLTVIGTLSGGAFTADTAVALAVSAGSAAASDFTAGTATLTIDAGQTADTATLTLTPVADDVDEADETVTVGGTATGLTVTGATVTITDDDTRGVKVSETSLTFTEGGSGTYTVALESQPTATVTVALSVSGDSHVTVSADTLTFTTTNWGTAQTVTVSGAQDADAANDTATVSHAVSGGDYGANNVTADAVKVTVNDDETASTGVTLSVSPNSVGEGDGATTLTVTGTLSGGAFTADTTVALSVSAGSATLTDDFAATTATLTISSGQTSGTADLTLTPVADDVDEADETVTVGGTATGLTVTGATVTITDDDTRGVKVSETTLAFTEGGSGTYTVKLESQPTATVKIALSVSGDSHVTVSADTLTFTTSNWGTAQTVTVSGAQDADAANDTATVSHAVSGGDYGANNVTADAVKVTVNDDETASTGVTLTVSPNSVGEGDGAATLTVTGTLSGGAFTADTTVALSVSAGSATLTDDFTATTATLTISSGQTSGTADLTLTPVGDAVDEGDETVAVGGTATGLTVTADTVTITDDDTRGVAVSETTLAFTEGGSGTYTVKLESQPTATVKIALSVSGDSHVTVSADTLTFTTSNWGTAQTVTVSGAQDADAANDTATVSHAVSGGDYGANNVTADAVKVTVNDDETASTGVTLSVSPNSVGEGDGATTLTVTGTLSGGAFTADTTVALAVSAGSAAASDFTADTATLTIAAGQTADTATLTLTPVADDVDEADETVTVGGTATGLTVTGATVTITDDDTRGVKVSKTTLAFTEGGSGTYTVKLESQPTATVKIALSVSGDSHVTVSADTLTFTTSNWGTAQTVTVSGAEDADAANDTATVRHTVSGGDYGANNVTADAVKVTVNDDETASTGVTLTVSPNSVGEGDGATTLTVTGTLSGGAFTADTTVALAVSAGSAAASDFTADTATLTIAAGQTADTATLTLTPVADDVDEADETVTVGGTATGLTVTGATVTITDDDTRGVKVSKTTLAFTEGGSGTYTVKLESQPTAAVTVGVSVSGDADVTVSADTLTFTTSNWGTAQTVTVSGAQDADAANDTATVSHAVGGGDYGANNVTADQVAVTVNDDETASTGVTLSVSPNSVGEGDGATTLTVTGTLSGGAFTADTTVALAVSAGSATLTDDFTAGSATLTITAGMTTGSADLTLTPVGDAVDEGDETVAVGGTATGLTVTGATVTITDDDTRGVKVSETSLTFTEGGSGTYTVKLESQPTATVTVGVSVSGDSDVTAAPSTLTFTTTNWGTAQTVTVSGDQDADAANDTATVSHTVGGGDYGANNVTADQVAVTVNDDETASTGVTLSVSPNSVGEGDGATTLTVTGTLSGGAFTADTTVALAVSAGSATLTDDYTATTATLTISSGQTTGTADLTLTPVGDAVDEGDETVAVGGSATGLTVTGATVTITDDDTRGVKVSETSLTFTEGGSGTYTVKLESQPTATVTVGVSVSGDSDVTAAPSTLTFTTTNWGTAQTVTVRAAEDTDAANDTATVSHTVGGGDYGANNVTADQVAVTVTDNDPASVDVSFAQAAYSVDEGGQVVVAVRLDAAPGQSVTIPLDETRGSGLASSEYSGVPASVTFGASQTERTFTVTTVEDTDVENDETLTLTFGTLPAGVNAGSPSTAVVTITDDDMTSVDVSFAQAAYSVDEGEDVEVAVRLDAAPGQSVTIPLDETRGSGLASGEYSGVPASVTFGASQTERTFTVTAVEDTDDEDDETLALTFGTLPAGVNAGSPSTAVVTIIDDDGNSPATGRPGITGSATVGETLTATAGNIADPDGFGAFDYQWWADGDEIDGATAASYELTNAEKGDKIKVSVTFTDGEGNAEGPLFSREVGPVAAAVTVPDAPIGLAAAPGDREVTLTWIAPRNTPGGTPYDGGSPVTRHEVRRDAGGWQRIPSSGEGGANHERWVVTGLTNGGTYTFAVRAVNAIGAGESSREVEATLGAGGGICGRTEEVRDFILIRLGLSADACGAVTADDLASINEGIYVTGMGITSLRSGDFDGLTKVPELELSRNELSSLPSGIFDDLGALKRLDLSKNRISSLRSGVFDQLTSLEELDMDDNNLQSLRTGAFDQLAALKALDMRDNDLTSFPYDAINELDVLTKLQLSGNPVYTHAVVVSENSLTITPGSSATYRVRLNTQPSGARIEPEADAGGVTVSPASVSYGRSDWFRYKEVTVSVASGVTASSATITHTAVSYGSSGMATPSVTVTIPQTASSQATNDVAARDTLLALVDHLTPDEASEALFGERRLSEAQLDALDALGNGNGSYDLGDLIAWIERCRSGGASCDGADPASDGGSPTAPPAAPPPQSGSRGRSRRAGGSGAGRRRGRPPAGGTRRRLSPKAARRRPSASRRVRGALLVALAAGSWGCGMGDGPVAPQSPEAESVEPHLVAPLPGEREAGLLLVHFTAPPGAEDIAAMLRLEGPAIDSVRAPGFELIRAAAASSTVHRVVIAGDLASGPMLEVWVPDVGAAARYRVMLLQIAGEGFALRDPARYEVAITR